MNKSGKAGSDHRYSVNQALLLTMFCGVGVEEISGLGGVSSL